MYGYVLIDIAKRVIILKIGSYILRYFACLFLTLFDFKYAENKIS